MKIGFKFSGISVCDNIIINGHHRYLASLLSTTSIDRTPTLKPSNIILINWDEIEYIDDDIESEERIIEHNITDAHFNGLSLEKLNELLK